MHVSATHVHVKCLLLRRNVASVDNKLTCYCLFLIDYRPHLRVSYYGLCHVPRKHCVRSISFQLTLTCFNSWYNLCFAIFIRRFHYSAFIVHGHYSTFLLLDISRSWSLVDVSITSRIQSMDITLRFSYSAFPSPAQTLYSTFLLLGVSRLPPEAW